MPIQHAIAHHLTIGPDSGRQINLRDTELPTEGHSESLLDKLKGSFLSRISREHGSFSTEDDTAPLEQMLSSLLGDQGEFVALSHQLSEAFMQRLEQNKAALDAHLLCYLEKSLDNHLFHLFVVGQTPQLALDQGLNIVTRYSLDTGSSLFGIKVDLNEWRERRDYAYLSLLPPRGNPPAAEAFAQLTGFANGIDKQASTLAFLEGVEAYARELPEEQVDDYRNKVVEYCMQREEQDAPVELRELAGSMEAIDADAFVRTVGEHTPEQQPEVMLDRRSLRRYVKFAGREKDLSISFNSYQLNKRVHYDLDTDTLSISGLPSALRKQLQGHLQEG
ncbi:MAG: nucleoid-associated protein [Pseudomonadota bacterium]